MRKQAFTLVELIVVITILAILGTIAFISLQGYSKAARDSTRLSDMGSIKKVLELYALDKGAYPLPSENKTDVTFSGSLLVWTQGTYGDSVLQETLKLSQVPLDPLTNTRYTYSVLNTQKEYEVAGILEGELSKLSNQTNAAGTTIAQSYTTGNFNGKVAKVADTNNTYVIAVPTLIASDLSNPDYQTIANNNLLAYKGTTKLPSSFSGTTFNTAGKGGESVIQSGADIVLHSGDINTINNSDFVTKLQEAYSGTTISNNTEISNLLNITVSDSNEVTNYASNMVNNSLNNNIVVSISSHNQSCELEIESYQLDMRDGVASVASIDDGGSLYSPGAWKWLPNHTSNVLNGFTVAPTNYNSAYAAGIYDYTTLDNNNNIKLSLDSGFESGSYHVYVYGTTWSTNGINFRVDNGPITEGGSASNSTTEWIYLGEHSLSKSNKLIFSRSNQNGGQNLVSVQLKKTLGTPSETHTGQEGNLTTYVDENACDGGNENNGAVVSGLSCKSLLDSGNTTDGVYSVDPGNTGTQFDVYCDMTNGGWMLLAGFASSNDTDYYGGASITGETTINTFVELDSAGFTKNLNYIQEYYTEIDGWAHFRYDSSPVGYIRYNLPDYGTELRGEIGSPYGSVNFNVSGNAGITVSAGNNGDEILSYTNGDYFELIEVGVSSMRAKAFWIR